MMIWASKILIVLVVLSISLPSFAVEVMPNKGKPGVWMSEAEFDKVLAERQELILLKTEKVPLLEKRIDQLDLLISQLTIEMDIMDKMSIKKDEIYAASIALEKAENDKLLLRIEKMEKWHRSPSTMLISGILIGGIMSIGLAFGLDEAMK